MVRFHEGVGEEEVDAEVCPRQKFLSNRKNICQIELCLCYYRSIFRLHNLFYRCVFCEYNIVKVMNI